MPRVPRANAQSLTLHASGQSFAPRQKGLGASVKPHYKADGEFRRSRMDCSCGVRAALPLQPALGSARCVSANPAAPESHGVRSYVDNSMHPRQLTTAQPRERRTRGSGWSPRGGAFSGARQRTHSERNRRARLDSRGAHACTASIRRPYAASDAQRARSGCATAAAPSHGAEKMVHEARMARDGRRAAALAHTPVVCHLRGFYTSSDGREAPSAGRL